MNTRPQDEALDSRLRGNDAGVNARPQNETLEIPAFAGMTREMNTHPQDEALDSRLHGNDARDERAPTG